MKNRLQIPDSEWDSAIEYFSTDPATPKYRREDSTLPHSFIKIDGTIYAMANLHLPEEESAFLGSGSFAEVKIVQNREGNNYALRIEGTAEAEEGLSSGHLVLKKLNRFFGTLFRTSKTRKEFYTQAGDLKQYTIEELIVGKELYEELCRNRYADLTERLIISYRILEKAHNLHLKNILHCDLKDSNVIINGIEADISVELIDFPFSIEIDDINDLADRDEIMGTPGYIAPETMKNGEYSTFSEVYSLGSLLYKPDPIETDEEDQHPLGLLYNYNLSQTLSTLLKSMHHRSPEKRPTIPIIKSYILKELHILYIKSKKEHNADHRIFDFMRKIKTEDSRAQATPSPLCPPSPATPMTPVCFSPRADSPLKSCFHQPIEATSPSHTAQHKVHFAF